MRVEVVMVPTDIHIYTCNYMHDSGRDERGGAKSSYDETPKFLRFVLYKENHTTTSAIAALAKQLRIKESRFAFAGMKDKRGAWWGL